jgi:hypothetical protein
LGQDRDSHSREEKNASVAALMFNWQSAFDAATD